MLKKSTIVFLFAMFAVFIWQFFIHKPIDQNLVKVGHSKTNAVQAAAPIQNETTPWQTMDRVNQNKKRQEDWYVLQVDWLVKRKKKLPEIQALSLWQNDLLEALDDHPEDRKTIESIFNQKLEKILGKKDADDFIRFKKEYDEKVK